MIPPRIHTRKLGVATHVTAESETQDFEARRPGSAALGSGVTLFSKTIRVIEEDI